MQDDSARLLGGRRPRRDRVTDQRRDAHRAGVAGPIDTVSPQGDPLRRVWIVNNLLAHNRGKYGTPGSSYAEVSGLALNMSFGMEDVRIEHNTLYDSRGFWAPPIWWGTEALAEGLRIADNVIWTNEAYALRGGGFCPLTDKAALDCIDGGHSWSHNTLISGWTDDTAATPRDKAPLVSATNGLSNTTVYDQSELGNLGWWDPLNLNFRLGKDSLLKSGGAQKGSDGTDRGVDMDKLERAIGYVRPGDVLDITATSATIPFHAPDRGAVCQIAYGTAGNPAGWTGRSGVDTGEHARSINLSGLAPGTVYQYRVWCRGTAQSETRQFRTAE